MSKLKDLCLNITDGEHGTVIDDTEGEYFLLSNKNIIDGNIYIGDNERKINKATFEKINKRTRLEQGDLLISTVGTIGKTAVICDEINYVFQRSVGIIKVDKNKINPFYLKYQLDNKEFQKRMIKLSKGAIQKCLYISDLGNLDIKLVAMELQNKIVNVLKKFDDKIKNNNKTILELESIAKTIYDYWFLQYEFPNEEGKPYKSSGGKMVYNEELKKEIPEGWSVKSIKDCIEHINTGLNPRDNFVLGNGNIKYITVKNLTNEGIINYDGCDVIDEKAKEIVHNRSEVDVGDILFASIAPLGRCFMVQEYPNEWDINESVFCIRPNQNVISTEYLYLYFTSESFIKQAENSSTGSIFSGIRINTLESIKLLVPNEKVKEIFSKSTKNIFLKKYKIARENEELTKLRDELLPLLMNGQVGFKK